MYKHMGKVMIKILQGSAVTQTVLGGLIRLTFFGPPCISIWLAKTIEEFSVSALWRNLCMDGTLTTLYF